MAKASMHFAYYLFLLTFYIDEGDGRWKKSDKENLQRDIKLYRKLSERVEHELEEYYAEYEDQGPLHFGPLHFNFKGKHYETKKNMPTNSAKLDSANAQQKKREPLLYKFTKVINNEQNYNKSVSNDSVSTNVIGTSVPRVKTIDKKSKWPKFEDILLAIGKKYDWKNDRWIKVKEKFKIKDDSLGDHDNSIMLHEKHRFSYRTIKLNRGKNKRNVVIAVTAIR